jgi:hypothetical protein
MRINHMNSESFNQFTSWRRAYGVRRLPRWAAALLGLAALTAQAQSQIFVENHTALPLTISGIDVSGDAISQGAWKRGATAIAQGERKKVLTLNRSGKVNWMDPTPRFIEPGKTAVFSTTNNADGHPAARPIVLRQKLTGTGKASKMWYSIQGASEPFAWTLENTTYEGVWSGGGTADIRFSYRAYDDKGDTHVEYVFR